MDAGNGANVVEVDAYLRVDWYRGHNIGLDWSKCNCVDSKKPMNLQQSIALVDRCLVTLCSDLPDSLGLNDTPRDRLSLSALRKIPLLHNLRENSRKHAMILDWMQTFVPKEDQALSSDIRVEEAENDITENDIDSDDVPEGKANGVGEEKQKESDKAVAKTIDISDSDDEFQNGNNDDKIAAHSSRDKSSILDSQRKAQKRKLHSIKSTNKSSTLPSMEQILSPEIEGDNAEENAEDKSDEFYIDDPDVYEVERILDKRSSHRSGKSVKYLIKWVGYEEPTWEPAENISKDLIREFEKNYVPRDEYIVDKILDRKAEVNEKTGLQTYFYLVKWVGYQDDTWEPADNLPHNLRRKFDLKCSIRKRVRLD